MNLNSNPFKSMFFFLALFVAIITNRYECAEAQETVAEIKISFRDQIRPILAEKCFVCHGPDAKMRKSELRLDNEASAKELAIVPGDVDASQLIARINSHDPAEMMPPPESGKELSGEQKELLKKWIAEGAHWQSHWAFAPISNPDVPVVASTWPNNSIDSFVLSKQLSAGLSPAPPADKTRLIRRVYLDLIGIVPTPEQVDAFLNDASENAFEKVVDDLLASPHYGEQMAVAWLDAARYADTNGYQNDFFRSMWPWRDWVIDAYNKNIPYDQFVVEQIAGDMLPNATRDQMIATGFNRNNRSVTEGGSIEEEWRIENGIDRVEATSATFLGLTFGCARCHDHKYDPISQKEFYRFFAFFNNIDEKGVYNEARGNVEPLLRVPTAEQEAALTELDNQIKELKNQVEPFAQEVSELVAQWDKEIASEPTVVLPESIFSLNGQKLNLVQGSASPIGTSLKFPGENDAAGSIDQPSFTFEKDVPFSWTAWVKGDSRGAIFGKMDEGSAYRGIDGIILGDGRLKIHLIHVWRDNAVAVISKSRLTEGEWTHVAVTYDGKAKASGYRIYFNGQPIETEVDIDALTDTIATVVPLKIGQRTKSEFFKGELADFAIYPTELAPLQISRMIKQQLAFGFKKSAGSEKTAGINDAVKRYVSLLGKQELIQKLNVLQTSREKLLSEQQTTMIMRERPNYRETFLLQRGQYDQPDQSDPLWPSIPAALPQLTDSEPPNRLGLARWMVDARNPLVARVAVNREWARFFGSGLVESLDNFGLQGASPTHPELLDWLANDFRRSGWDLKRLQKQIVMSATYQQSSDVPASKRERDPENRWYARGPRIRLSGEQLRDNALAISGLLVEKIGGPSVRPYQPVGLWEELAGGAHDGPYKLGVGEELYRRSLYTYRKRTVSHPTLSTFDAPSWEICQIKRSLTNTPLQSLALLNDVTYVEAARKFAERILKDGGDSIDEKIRFAFRRATLRMPHERELETLKSGFNEYLEHYQSNIGDAQELLKTGQSKYDEQRPSDQLAAMTLVASVILNLDEVITKE